MAAWDQLPDEPNRWYARFERFRLRGPKRTLEAVFRSECGDQQVLAQKRPGQAWYRAAARWEWQRRAEAWDKAERARLRGLEAQRRFDERERRLSLIDKLLAAAEGAFDKAMVDHASTEEARVLLPTVRLFLRDLITAQRAELGPAQVDAEDGVAFTADDLVAAAKAMGREAELARLRDVLADLYPDESSSRRIAQAAGLNLSRVRFQATAVDTWHAILTVAEHAGQVEAVVAVVTREYGANSAFREAARALRE